MHDPMRNIKSLPKMAEIGSRQKEDAMKLPVTRPLTIEEYTDTANANTHESPNRGFQSSCQKDNPVFTDQVKQGTENTKRLPRNTNHNNSHACQNALGKDKSGHRESPKPKQASVNVIQYPSNVQGLAKVDKSGLSASRFVPILPVQSFNSIPIFTFTPLMGNIMNNPVETRSPNNRAEVRATVPREETSIPADKQAKHAKENGSCTAGETETRKTCQSMSFKPSMVNMSNVTNTSSYNKDYSTYALGRDSEKSHNAAADPSSSSKQNETSVHSVGNSHTAVKDSEDTYDAVAGPSRPCQQNVKPIASVDGSCQSGSETTSEDEQYTESAAAEVDSLTDTINRVAAGEGVIRQRFTPKIKRKRVVLLHKEDINKGVSKSDVNMKSDTSYININKTRRDTEYLQGSQSTQQSLLGANFAGNKDANTIFNSNMAINTDKTSFAAINSNSSLKVTNIPENADPRKLVDHYLLDKNNDDNRWRINYEISMEKTIDKDTNINHYLLKTPPRTVLQKEAASQECGHLIPKTIDTDHYAESLAKDTNQLLDRRPHVSDQSIVHVDKRQTECQRQNDTKYTQSKEVSAPTPTVRLERLRGLSPDKTVFLNTKNANSAQVSMKEQTNALGENTILNEEKPVNEQNALKKKDISKPASSKERSMEENRHVSTQMSKSAMSPTLAKEEQTYLTQQNKRVDNILHKQPQSRVLSNKKTALHKCIVPKLNTVDNGNNSKNTDRNTPSNRQQNQKTEETSLKQGIAKRHILNSPKAITKDIYEYLVSNSKFLSSMKAPRAVANGQNNTTVSPANSAPNLANRDPTPSTSFSIYSNKPEYKTEIPISASDFSSKKTVAQLLKAKRSDLNPHKRIPVNNPLKMYGKIANPGSSKSGTTAGLETTNKDEDGCHSKYIGIQMNLKEQQAEGKVPQNTSCQRQDMHKQAGIRDSGPVTNMSQPSVTERERSVAALLTKETRPVSVKMTSLEHFAGEKKENHVQGTLTKPFSIKIKDQVYIVRPANVTKSSTSKTTKNLQVAIQHQPKKITLPAPKSKDALCRKRRKSPTEDQDQENIIKKKITRIVKRRKGPKERLAHTLELMPSHKKAKRIRRILKKGTNVTLSPTNHKGTSDSDSINDNPGPSCLPEKVDGKVDLGAGMEKKQEHENYSGMKVAITMVISKSFDGKYKYSIQKTKFKFLSRECAEFRRWFPFSNYPCSLHFKAGKGLEQIDAETIQQGLYMIMHADRAVSDVTIHTTAVVSADLALYPPHVACIPVGTDVVVIGKITDTDTEQTYPDTSDVDNMEHLFNIVLGAKVLQDAAVFADDRYRSDPNISPKCHSPMFYTREVARYFTDEIIAPVTDTKAEKITSRSVPFVTRDNDNVSRFVNYSEKALALKIKQQKLLEELNQRK